MFGSIARKKSINKRHPSFSSLHFQHFEILFVSALTLTYKGLYISDTY